jgi:hypothetical protein
MTSLSQKIKRNVRFRSLIAKNVKGIFVFTPLSQKMKKESPFSLPYLRIIKSSVYFHPVGRDSMTLNIHRLIISRTRTVNRGIFSTRKNNQKAFLCEMSLRDNRLKENAS